MAKLQLYINKSLRGYKNIVNINPEEEVAIIFTTTGRRSKP